MQADRRRRSEQVLDGYAHGPDATLAATAEAVQRAATARSLILVEGISDVIALEALATRTDQDLAASGVVVVPMGGAQAITRFLADFGPDGAGLRLSGLCDAGEEECFIRAITQVGLGSPTDRRETETLGFFVCVDDLEQELIRAAGPGASLALLESQGDLGSFQTLQKQAAWKTRRFDAQLHRFLRAGARRNLRYARLFVDVIELGLMPRPLVGVLESAVRS